MNANTFTTGEVRFSYPHLLKPDSAPGVAPSYSVVAMIPKTDAATINAFNAAWQDAINFGISNKWNGTQPPILQGGLKDGDGLKDDGTPYGPECKGHFLLTCKTNVENPPEIVDQALQPVIDARKIYAGCYGRVNVSLVPYNNQSKGIKAILNCVQVLRDGEPLGGSSVSASEAFGAPAAPAYPQAGYPAPAAPVGYAPPAAPAYPAQAAPAYPQAGYPAPAPAGYPAAQAYPQPGAPSIDPITGKPLPSGMPVMGM